MANVAGVNKTEGKVKTYESEENRLESGPLYLTLRIL